MTKKIFFDMDGTIADLYNTNNWLDLLLNETKGLFRNLKVMHDKKRLQNIIVRLQDLGYQVEVITWTPKDVSAEYIETVKQEKIEWIAEHFPMIENIHCLGYGIPKQKAEYKKSKLQILVDDNLEVLETWKTPKQRQTIVADKNLMEKLEILCAA